LRKRLGFFLARKKCSSCFMLLGIFFCLSVKVRLPPILKHNVSFWQFYLDLLIRNESKEKC